MGRNIEAEQSGTVTNNESTDRHRDSDDGASGTGAATDEADSTQTDYLATLRRWFEKNKSYPQQARIGRQEGTAILRVIFDRDGYVLEYELVRSSGHATLDREVKAMIERAAPLPPIPAELNRRRLELRVPIQFSLR